jgi:hypothetical protein
MKYIVMANGESKIVEALDFMDLVCYQLTQEEQNGLQAIVVWEESEKIFEEM